MNPLLKVVLVLAVGGFVLKWVVFGMMVAHGDTRLPSFSRPSDPSTNQVTNALMKKANESGTQVVAASCRPSNYRDKTGQYSLFDCSVVYTPAAAQNHISTQWCVMTYGTQVILPQDVPCGGPEDVLK